MANHNQPQEHLDDIICSIRHQFTDLNEDFFNSEIETPVIAVVPTKGKRQEISWCTTKHVWKDSTQIGDDGSRSEINICAEALNCSAEILIGALLHEMVHLYNAQNGNNDNSREGNYHNTTFRDTALSHGLNVQRDKSKGWCNTSLNNEGLAFLSRHGITQGYSLFRYTAPKETKQSSRGYEKFECPNCERQIAFGSKKLLINCRICGAEMVIKNRAQSIFGSNTDTHLVEADSEIALDEVESFNGNDLLNQEVGVPFQ